MDPEKNVVSYEDLVEGILTLPTEEAKRTFVSVLKGLENLARVNKIKITPIKGFRHAKAEAVDSVTVIRWGHVEVKHNASAYWFHVYPNRYQNKSGWKHNASWNFTLEEFKNEIEKNKQGAIVTKYESGDDAQRGLEVSFFPEIKTKEKAEELRSCIAGIITALQNQN